MASDPNRPVVRAKGFGKPEPAPVAPPAVAPPSKPPEAPAPPPEVRVTAMTTEVPFVEAPVVIAAPVQQPIPVRAELVAPVARSGNYVADLDPERVARRQWWKYNLFMKSGRVAQARPGG